MNFSQNNNNNNNNNNDNNNQPVQQEASEQSSQSNKKKRANPMDEVLYKLTLSDIHQAILTTKSKKKAAEKLNTEEYKLYTHLLKFGTSYKELKKVLNSPRKAAKRFKFYYTIDPNLQPVQEKKLSLCEIHTPLYETKDKSKTAKRLGIKVSTLTRLISEKFKYVDPEDWLTLSPEQLEAKIGSNRYHEKIAFVIRNYRKPACKRKKKKRKAIESEDEIYQEPEEFQGSEQEEPPGTRTVTQHQCAQDSEGVGEDSESEIETLALEESQEEEDEEIETLELEEPQEEEEEEGEEEIETLELEELKWSNQSSHPREEEEEIETLELEESQQSALSNEIIVLPTYTVAPTFFNETYSNLPSINQPTFAEVMPRYLLNLNDDSLYITTPRELNRFMFGKSPFDALAKELSLSAQEVKDQLAILKILPRDLIRLREESCEQKYEERFDQPMTLHKIKRKQSSKRNYTISLDNNTNANQNTETSSMQISSADQNPEIEREQATQSLEQNDASSSEFLSNDNDVIIPLVSLEEGYESPARLEANEYPDLLIRTPQYRDLFKDFISGTNADETSSKPANENESEVPKRRYG